MFFRKQKIHDESQAAFNLYQHRFGMAYTTGLISKPFYPHSFRDSSIGAYCDSVFADGKPVKAQWVTHLRRAPDYDMMTKKAATDRLTAFCDRFRGIVVNNQDYWQRDGEHGMAEGAAQIVKDLDREIETEKAKP